MARILIMSDSFLPEGNAAAVHMTELQKFYDKAGVETFIATSAVGELDIGRRHLKSVVRFPNYWKRSNKYILRAAGEFMSAVFIGLMLRFSSKFKDINRVIVYSPTVFWGLTLMLANVERNKVYYVLRDIFPLWIVQAGILTQKSIAYKVLDLIARLQFKTAEKIFVQSDFDRELLEREYSLGEDKVKILQTWMDDLSVPYSSNFDNLIDGSSKNILWLGNMGVAQNRDFVISVFNELITRCNDITINIVGVKKQDRQVLTENLVKCAKIGKQVNIIHQLSHADCVQLALKSDLGIFSLGWQTTDGNIPGKFITYAMAELPIFGMCSENAEIASLVRLHGLGSCYHGSCHKTAAKNLMAELHKNHDKQLIKQYFQNHHSTEYAATTLME